MSPVGQSGRGRASDHAASGPCAVAPGTGNARFLPVRFPPVPVRCTAAVWQNAGTHFLQFSGGNDALDALHALLLFDHSVLFKRGEHQLQQIPNKSAAAEKNGSGEDTSQAFFRFFFLLLFIFCVWRGCICLSDASPPPSPSPRKPLYPEMQKKQNAVSLSRLKWNPGRNAEKCCCWLCWGS